MWGELTKLTEQRCRDLEDGLGLLVQVLSLDVAIDQDYGNLDSSSQNWAKIAQAVSNGWVAAAVLATLSVRQGIINLQKQKDVIGPWGISGLKPKEMRQLLLRSTFALQTLWIVTSLLSQGAAMISEHPGIPTDPTRVSIWKVALTQLILQHPSAILHTVPQGLFGASAWKRTGLLAVNLPRMMTSMGKWRTSYCPGTRDDWSIK